MMRQASLRNQRNKGLRLNNILQICILTLVFFWLLYQLKHSFDEKKGPDEHRSRSLNNVIDSHSGFAVLGRKALPHDQGIVSDGETSNEDKENEEKIEKGRESQHTMDDEEVKEIPEDGIDELDNEQEDEQDEEAEDGDDAVNEEEKDEQVEEAEFLDDQDPEENDEEEFSSLHPDRSNATGDRNNHNVGTNSSEYSVEKLDQEASPIDHSKLKGNLLTAAVLDVPVNPQTNETLGKNNLLLPLDDTSTSLQRNNDKSNTTLAM